MSTNKPTSYLSTANTTVQEDLNAFRAEIWRLQALVMEAPTYFAVDGFDGAKANWLKRAGL